MRNFLPCGRGSTPIIDSGFLLFHGFQACYNLLKHTDSLLLTCHPVFITLFEFELAAQRCIMALPFLLTVMLSLEQLFWCGSRNQEQGNIHLNPNLLDIWR